MADLVLSSFSLVDGALSKVISLITDEIILVWGLHMDLEKLKDSLCTIRYMLQYAEQQQVTHVAVTWWLKQLKDVACDAEDMLDEFAYESLRRKVEVQHQPETKVCNFFPLSKSYHYVKKVAFRQKMAHKIKNLLQSMDEIQKKGIGLGLIRAVVPQVRQQPETYSVPNRVTDSVLDNSRVVGREDDVYRIVDLLTRYCDQQILTVIPIVGMGGLGKTTLAKLVFNEAKERKLFYETLWVCVSDNFEYGKILKEMLEGVDKSTGGLTNVDAISGHLKEKLGEKKFLLVLDDVWNENREKWDNLKRHLIAVSRNNGNAVIVTTRTEGVASTVETSSLYRHKLTLLPDDACWSIIKQRVVGDGGALIPSDMEAIGKEIAEKCRGVPLVAKVLGGTMSFNRDKKVWLSIRNSSVLNTVETEDSILPILRLSFDRLPSYLKPCFAYCSIFPKDSFIKRKKLIQLWMAEGLLESSSDQDVGNKYFNALLLNSFFQDTERDEFDNIRRCKMHDLIHDLALSISNSETLIAETCSVGDISRVRHLNLTGDGKPMPIFPKYGAKKLRSLFITDALFHESWMFKSLRTLNLESSDLKQLPSSIGKLKHLRYLDVSSSNIKAFPESIIKLYNLQTLRFLRCFSLKKIPRDMSNLISLRHIEFSYAEQMPGKMGPLTRLETLPIFVVGPDRGGDIQELECLNRLGGELTIMNLHRVKGKKEAEKANLQQKTELKALRLEWRYERQSIDNNNEEVLEGLVPHSNIESIVIKEYSGEKLPQWLLMMKIPSHGDSFTVFDNLVKLILIDCRRCEEIPRLGHLPRLKILELYSMVKVRYIGNEFYGIVGQSSNTKWRLYPALKVLSLKRMQSLVEWRAPAVDEGGDVVTVFPCLEELCIQYCRRLRKIPIGDGSSLVKLEIRGCDELSYLFDELHSFPCLESLTIEECNALTNLPRGLQSCMSLEELSIRWCEGLTSVKEEDLGNLGCLVSLEITGCPRLSYIAERILCMLTGLKRLTIGEFSKELDDFPYLNSIQDLPSLEDLIIYGRHRDKTMSQLPHQLQCLTALVFLKISDFDGMEVLPDWLGNLTSLQSLEISYCENLKYLPTATAMQRLSQLNYLLILKCPLIEESCAQGSGSEWHKISHIPTINITRFHCLL